MISNEQAQHFSEDWIDSWNSHSMERILKHYAEEVEYFSPFLPKLTDNTNGRLQGKTDVAEYLAQGLQAYPDLNFKFIAVFTGIASVTIQYESVNNLIAAEVFELNEQGLAIRVQCHYREK